MYSYENRLKEMRNTKIRHTLEKRKQNGYVFKTVSKESGELIIRYGFIITPDNMWLPQWLIVKESACTAGDVGSIPGWGRSPGEGNDNPLQYSCLENPMDKGAWWATVHGVTKSQT